MKVIAYCESCKHQHAIDFDPMRTTNEFADWRTKHTGHAGVGYMWPQRSTKPSFIDRFRRAWSYLWHPTRPGLIAEANPYFSDRMPDGIAAFLHNADAKISYVASSAVTIALASLASSSTKLAGVESDLIDNSTNKYLDYGLAGKTTVGTTPTTAKSIDVTVVGISNDTTWPDVFDGTGSAETVTTQEIKDNVCKPFQTLQIVSTTSDIAQPFGPGSVASRFGGVVPLKWVVFMAHDTVAALNATAGNHVVSITPSYITIV